MNLNFDRPNKQSFNGNIYIKGDSLWFKFPSEEELKDFLAEQDFIFLKMCGLSNEEIASLVEKQLDL